MKIQLKTFQINAIDELHTELSEIMFDITSGKKVIVISIKKEHYN